MNTLDLNIDTFAQISTFLKETNVCPYCAMDIESDDTTCMICGQNLENNDVNVKEDLNEGEVIDMIKDIMIKKGIADEETADMLLNPHQLSDIDLDDALYVLKQDNYKYDRYPLALYDVLNAMTYTYDLLEEIVAFADLYNVSEEKLTANVLENGYCSEYILSEHWEYLAGELTKKDLQKILRKNKLKVSGNKKDLIKRIEENVDVETIKFSSLLLFKDEKNPVYLLTQKGFNYIEDNVHIDIFNSILYEYNFDEYTEYLEKHEDKVVLEATIIFKRT